MNDSILDSENLLKFCSTLYTVNQVKHYFYSWGDFIFTEKLGLLLQPHYATFVSFLWCFFYLFDFELCVKYEFEKKNIVYHSTFFIFLEIDAVANPQQQYT